MNCSKCGDKVDMNAGHVCLTGNDRLKERITYLQARIAELENAMSSRLRKVIESNKNFLIVTETEPYYMEVYDLIREHEKHSETWTLDDEIRYAEALQKQGEEK